MTIRRRKNPVPDYRATWNQPFRWRDLVSVRRPLGTEGPINFIMERAT